MSRLLIAAGVVVLATVYLGLWALAAIAADADRRAEDRDELEALGYVIAPDDEP